MSVAGEVRGNIQLSGRLEIFSSGKVFGEITVSSLAIEEGGVFRGKCDMGKNGAGAGADDVDTAMSVASQES
jgi:cytoskeletal protein CcmA (bactofilin family)